MEKNKKEKPGAWKRNSAALAAVLFIFLAIIFAAPSVAAQGYGTAASTKPLVMNECDIPSYVSFAEQSSLLAIAVVFVSFFLAVAFMISQLTQNHGAEAWVKAEISETFMSGLMIFAVVVGSVALATAASSIAHSDKSHICVAEEYLDKLISREGVPLVVSLVQGSFDNRLWATDFTYSSPPLLGGSGIARHGEKKAYAESQDAATDLLIPMIASLRVQRILLEGIQSFAWVYLLPLGFVLRLIPYMRGTADFIIAVAIGFYIVFPLTYVVNGQVINEIDNPKDAQTAKIVSDLNWNPDLYLPFNAIGRLIPQAVFFPNLSIILTVSFIMGFSKMLSHGFDAGMME
ncbi:Uncharacterised protein [Candidatus Gugararchaeum adminiculabundum]|nr:Uncharacterised protein [Candidatus Gugararchaeum adminiculabundum]